MFPDMAAERILAGIVILLAGPGEHDTVRDS